MPLSCDCYPGCWGQHAVELGWLRVTDPRLMRLLQRVLPRGTYVAYDDYMLVEREALMTACDEAIANLDLPKE